MKKLIWFLFLCLTALSIYLAVENRNLNQQIKDQKELLLITHSQLKANNELISRAEEKILNARAGSMPSSPDPNDQRINSRISGEFLGWNGGTVFRLQDGTAWQQATHDVYFFRANEPAVEIYRKNNVYFLKVAGADREIQVIPYK